MQCLGLQIIYRENLELKSSIRKTAALAFVQWRYVHLAWQALKAEAPQNIIRLDDFISYFKSTLLVGSYPPASLWNVFETKSARTNNHIEGWHSKLKKVVGKAHPNVYEIVEIFKREQGVTEITISHLAEPFLLEEGRSLQTKIKEYKN